MEARNYISIWANQSPTSSSSNLKPIHFKCTHSIFDSAFISDSDHSRNGSTKSSYTESTLSSPGANFAFATKNNDTDADIIFSNFQGDNNFLYSLDSPLLPKVPTRKVHKSIDRSPSSYLPLSTIQRTVNGDNAKNVLKQR